ncbi:MAG: hypothetical protein PHF00_05605 [Elusimicrobia bacterium]|nr:hypothetical protein [Elusimicrobiota bacterium]
MKRKMMSAVATLMVGGLSVASAQTADFERQVLSGSQEITLAAKAVGQKQEANVAADMLRQAVAMRQQIRRYILEHGGRLTKEQIGTASGYVSGSFLGFSGSFNQEQQSVLLKDGEFFVMVKLSPETNALIEALRAKIDAKEAVGECAQSLLFRLEAIKRYRAGVDDVTQIKSSLKDFQSLLDRLEMKLAQRPASDADKAQFMELVRWGRNSIVRVMNVSSYPYKLAQSWMKSMSFSKVWGINFETPGVSSFYTGCYAEDSQARIDGILKYSFVTQAEDIPVY